MQIEANRFASRLLLSPSPPDLRAWEPRRRLLLWRSPGWPLVWLKRLRVYSHIQGKNDNALGSAFRIVGT